MPRNLSKKIYLSLLKNMLFQLIQNHPNLFQSKRKYFYFLEPVNFKMKNSI